MRKYDALINQYFEQCLIRGIGPSTINTRRREVERFGAWVKRKKPKPMLEEINLEMVIHTQNKPLHLPVKSTFSLTKINF